MSKKIEDYLHLYMGCECLMDGTDKGRFIGYDSRLHDKEVQMAFITIQFNEFNAEDWTVYNDDEELKRIKLLLRPLSDMTEDEAEHFAWLCMDGRHRDKEYSIDKEEIDIELVPNDGGNMLDGNLQIYIGVTCRCWTGYIAITNYGEIKQCEEDSERREPIDNIAEKVAYLLSCGFDLFNLIPEGLAIDKTLE